MIRPAVMYKDQLQQLFYSQYYTDKYMYYEGSLEDYRYECSESSQWGKYEYVSVDESDKDHPVVTGYFGYTVDFYSSSVYNFGLYSFMDSYNIELMKFVKESMENIVQKFHRTEFRCISGNKVERNYDRFCHDHKGTKHIMKDVFKDKHGKYHDDLVYEIINHDV